MVFGWAPVDQPGTSIHKHWRSEIVLLGVVAQSPHEFPWPEFAERLGRILPKDWACVIGGYRKIDMSQFDALLCAIDESHVELAVAACNEFQSSSSFGAVLAAAIEPAHDQLHELLAVGATDLFYLPVTDRELEVRVRRAFGVVDSPSASKQAGSVDERLKHIVARDAKFQAILANIPALANCDATVLIQGETGTGKEVIAQAIHYLSSRAGNPWVPINCGAIPVDLMESELFGHVRGAYTTASSSRSGLVTEAEGGTIFLDDVDCMPLAAQTKLLRLLQEQEYRAVGSNTIRKSNIRVIAASNCNLAAAAEHGSFRRDLYYRLNILSVKLPALRERREDIEPLARHFIRMYAKRFGGSARSMTPSALRKLLRHKWPGNVRELQYTIERAIVLSSTPVLDAVDIQIDGDTNVLEPRCFREAKAQVVNRFEQEYIRELLAKNSWNISRAAREAGKDRRAFFELMRKHEIRAAE